jgi:hypothetical protein
VPGKVRGEARAELEPLPPFKKWKIITIATLLLVPSYWLMLAGLVASATEGDAPDINPGAALALGLALVPFVFVVLAFMSEHPTAPGAVVRAMGISLLVGIPASALAGDAVTGIVAGVGAGGVVALRMDVAHTYKYRIIGVVIAAGYTFMLVRLAGAITLLPAPIFPLTAIGIADHLAERAMERRESE